MEKDGREDYIKEILRDLMPIDTTAPQKSRTRR